MTTVAADARPARAGRGTPWRRYLAMPVFLALVTLGVWLWVSFLELDSIEQRLLTEDAVIGILGFRFDVPLVIEAVVRHIELVAVSTFFVILLAVPAGILLTRRNRFAPAFGPPILAAANAGQTVPSIGILALLALYIGFGFRFAVIALIAYAFLPILRNTMVGIEQVDESVIESALGMGMSKRQVLTRIELPLAIPVMLAGIRTALVINVGTATVATLVNSGGMGDIVYGGIITRRNNVMIAGAILTAVLALLIDYLAGLAEERLRPKGL